MSWWVTLWTQRIEFIYTVEAFLCFPERGPKVITYRETFTVSRGPLVLHIKEEDVVTALPAGVRLGGTNLDFEMGQFIYERQRWWPLHHEASELLGEASVTGLCHFAVKNLAGVMSYPPGIWIASCPEGFAASGALPILAAPPSESSLTKSRQPPSSPSQLPVVTNPRANHQPFTLYLNLPTCFRSGWSRLPLAWAGQAALCGSEVQGAGGKALPLHGIDCHEYLHEMAKDEQATPEKLLILEEFQGG